MKHKTLIAVILLFCLTVPSINASGYDPQAATQALSLSGTSAEGCMLYCLDTDEVVYATNENKRLPIASTTKIMTAVVALENADIADTVKVPAEAVGIEGSSAYLMKDERISIKDLLYAMMLESANDAATALAVVIGGDVDGFVDMMNLKATELGMSDTHFTNPHGLDDEHHYSTAYDMALLCDYAMDNDTFADITGCYRYETDNRLFVNHNRLLKTCEGVVGGKTGFTKRSGRCLVSVASRDGVRMCAVTLNDPNDWKDHKALFDAGFDAYGTVTLKGDEYSIPVINGVKDMLTAVAPDISVVCKRTDPNSIEIKVCHERFCYAPVNKGMAVGYLIYTANGKEIARTELKVSEDIEKIKNKTFIEKIISFIFQD